MSIRTKLISQKHVREFALLIAGGRAHRFTRVGGSFLVTCEAHLKEYIRQSVLRLPSRGRTIK